MNWLLSALVGLLALLGAPLFIIILSATLVGFLHSGTPLAVVAIELFRLVDTPLLLALPLFTFAGYVLAESRIAERLVALAGVFFGWMPAGLALLALVLCTFFTAFTGASGVTIVALGALLLPGLKAAGYPERFNLGLITTSGSLGLLIAPSLPLILYGVLVQQMDLPNPFTLRELFIAGLLPALLMILLLLLFSIWRTRGEPVVRQAFSRREAVAALWAARWELPLPVVVLGGIYSGYFAVSEAAVVTCVYVLVVETLILREVSFGALLRLTREAMVMAGGILLILGASLAFTSFLIDTEAPQQLFSLMRQYIVDKFTFLLLLNLVLLLLGAFLDIFSALVIMLPMIVPLALGYGVDPVHLGIIFLANMQLGYFTPPIGMNLFIASFRFNRPITELYQATLPFMLVLLLALAIITYVPEVSLLLLDRG